MSNAIIWDLDGTLLDSYSVIVDSLYLALQEFELNIPKNEIWEYAIKSSSTDLVNHLVSGDKALSQRIFDRYGKISGSKYLEIVPMTNALELLEHLRNKGVQQFVFTHRGKTTLPVLKNLGMDTYFTEVVTSQSGYPRKPQPDAITYLMEKYHLDPNYTYYGGDRTLDMECAKNAGIMGIFYLPNGSRAEPNGSETYIVNDLMDIENIV